MTPAEALRLPVVEPYLGSELGGLGLLLVLFGRAGPERRRMLLAGAVLLPMLPMVPLLDLGYWAPRRLGGLLVGLEDLLYMMHVGAAAWFFATRAQGFQPGNRAMRRALPRGLALTGIGLLAMGGLAQVGIGWSDALLLTAATIGLVLLARQPAHWRAALGGGLGNLFWLGLQLRLWFEIWPELAGWWEVEAWTGWLLFGLPIGDLAYVMVIGAVHPLAIAWLLEGGFFSAKRPS